VDQADAQADARGATTGPGRPAQAATAGDARPTRASLVRPLVQLLASGAALVGIVLLLTSFVTLGTRSLDASESGDVPCLEAVSAEAVHARVDNGYLPPRATCTWFVDGELRTVVVAEPSATVFWAGLVLAAGGVLTCVGVLVAARRKTPTRLVR